VSVFSVHNLLFLAQTLGKKFFFLNSILTHVEPSIKGNTELALKSSQPKDESIKIIKK